MSVLKDQEINYLDKIVEYELKPLRMCINEQVHKMYQDIPSSELGSKNILNGVTYDEFENICNKYLEEEKFVNKELNTTTNRYILCIDDYPVGEVGIRTSLNDFWINRGSQIFYKIRSSERGNGYGNIILELALKEASRLGFKVIRINCDNKNEPSKKIIIKNGGVVDIKDYKTSEGISSSYIINLDKWC